MTKRIPFTPLGYNAVKDEYETLHKNRPAAVLDLKKAREMGDLSENGYYKAARWKLSGIDSNLRRLKMLLSYGVVIVPMNNKTVSIGCLITLQNEDRTYKYTIVGNFEANPAKGKISYISPLGSELVGKKVGDQIETIAPAGKIKYNIVKIEIEEI